MNVNKFVLIKVRQDVDFYNEPVNPKYEPFAFRMISNSTFQYIKTGLKQLKRRQFASPPDLEADSKLF